MDVRCRVERSQTERAKLTARRSDAQQRVSKLKRPQILRAADAAAGDEEIDQKCPPVRRCRVRTKRRFALGNVEAALGEEPRRGASRQPSGVEEALLVAIACAHPHTRRAR
jgi:hypothetical protein